MPEQYFSSKRLPDREVSTIQSLILSQFFQGLVETGESAIHVVVYCSARDFKMMYPRDYSPLLLTDGQIEFDDEGFDFNRIPPVEQIELPFVAMQVPSDDITTYELTTTEYTPKAREAVGYVLESLGDIFTVEYKQVPFRRHERKKK